MDDRRQQDSELGKWIAGDTIAVLKFRKGRNFEDVGQYEHDIQGR